MSSSNCCFLTYIQISQEAGQVVSYSHLLKNFPQFIVIHTVKGFGIVNKAEIGVFLELSCFFDDQQILAIWSLVPLPFLKPAWISGSSQLTRSFRYDLNKIPYEYIVEVRNRFKGLDLIDREPDELWTEVRDIVQETGIKTIPMEKKFKKAKWLSEEALQIAVKWREAKSKGEKERCYIWMQSSKE